MSNLKQKHKDYLIKNEIKDLTDLVNYIEILRNTSNLQGEDRQMLFDFAFLIVNEQSSLKSFFAENFRQELYNQLGIANNNVNVKSSDSCFTKTSDIIDEINIMDKNPSKEFYNAFKKFSKDEDMYERVRGNFYRYLNDNTPGIVVADFKSLEKAKIFFKNSPTLTEAFYYEYGTNELIESEEKSKNSPTFMDEVLDSVNSTRHKSKEGETHTEVPNFKIYNYLDFQLPQYPNLEERNKAIEDSLKNTVKVLTGEATSGDTFELGKKEKEGKLHYELSWEFIEEMAKRMANNKSDKYPLYNWKQKINIQDLKDAINRHHIEVMKGNYQDGDEILGHIVQYACNSMMLWEQLRSKS